MQILGDVIVTAAVIGLLFLFLAPFFLSSRISEQERREYFEREGRWPEW